MAFRFHLIPPSLRRRSFLTSLAVLLVILLSALLIVWQAAGLKSRSQASLVQLGDEPANQMALIGSGINLTGLPATNLISRASFSPFSRHALFFAEEGGADYFDVKMGESRDPLPLVEAYYQEASFQLFRESLAEMTLLGQGQVASYEPGLVSAKREVKLPDLPDRVRWQAFTESREGTAYIGGTGGALIKVEKEGAGQRVPFRFPSDITAMAAGPAGLIAGDAQGQFYASPDGLTWNLMAQTQAEGPVRAISYIDLPDWDNGFFLASGGPGELFFGHPSGLEALSFPLEDQVTALVKTGDGLLYALGDQGRAAFSSNGISWQEDGGLTSGRAWLAADSAGGVTLFVGQEGQIALREDKGQVQRMELADFSDTLTYLIQDGEGETWPDLADVLVLSSSKLVIITSDGRLISSKDGGKNWGRENPLAESGIDRLKLLPSGDIYISRRDGRLVQAELTARIGFRPALRDDRVQAGDLLSLAASFRPSLDTRDLKAPFREELPDPGEWLVSAGASFSLGPDAGQGRPGQDTGGAASLTYTSLLPGQKEPDLGRDSLFSVQKGTLAPISVNNPNRPYLQARLAQKLDLSRLIKNDPLPFYRLEFDFRFTGKLDGPVEVWFSGSLPDVGEGITLEGEGWQHRRISLLFPRGLKVDDELWFNIGFAGSGTLYLDNLWFGRSDDAPGALSSLLEAEVGPPRADVIRLDAVPIGRPGYPAEAWSLAEGAGCSGGRDVCFHNLGAALGLVEGRGAVPWLVVDLYATEEELIHLVEYLAGSPLTAYGRLRSRDGAIGRWTDAFNFLYIEIADTSSVLPNDASRANYVHWMMDRIKSSPDFQAIRNKVFFVDAMVYDDGRSHTSADYHAGDFMVKESLTSLTGLEAAVQAFVNTIPRGKISGGLLSPELIRSLKLDRLEATPRLVDLVAPALADLGRHSGLVLLDMNFGDPTSLSGQDIASRALAALEGLGGLRLLEDPVILRRGDFFAEDEGPDKESLALYAFSWRGVTRFYALNLGQSARIVSVQGIDRQKEARYLLYDHRGNVISQGVWKWKRDHFTLLPGGLLVIRQDEVTGP